MVISAASRAAAFISVNLINFLRLIQIRTLIKINFSIEWLARLGLGTGLLDTVTPNHTEDRNCMQQHKMCRQKKCGWHEGEEGEEKRPHGVTWKIDVHWTLFEMNETWMQTILCHCSLPRFPAHHWSFFNVASERRHSGRVSGRRQQSKIISGSNEQFGESATMLGSGRHTNTCGTRNASQWNKSDMQFRLGQRQRHTNTSNLKVLPLNLQINCFFVNYVRRTIYCFGRCLHSICSGWTRAFLRHERKMRSKESLAPVESLTKTERNAKNKANGNCLCIDTRPRRARHKFMGTAYLPT